MLRLDEVHPHVSGNKWWKLKYNLKSVVDVGYDGLLTFGGAFSNHIAATAAAGKVYGIRTIGIIRGEATSQNNPTLNFAKDCGMELHFVDRTTYRDKENPAYLEQLKAQFGNVWIVPEGGKNKLGVSGVSEILESLDEESLDWDGFDYDYVALACGTGTTLAGISLYLTGNRKVIGVSALKGGEYLEGEIDDCLAEFSHNAPRNFELWHHYHFGGFAKVTDELIAFMREFYVKTQIKLDPIYTGKMVYGVLDEIKKGLFPVGSRILLIHTGGLQGIAGMEQRLGYSIYED